MIKFTSALCWCLIHIYSTCYQITFIDCTYTMKNTIFIVLLLNVNAAVNKTLNFHSCALKCSISMCIRYIIRIICDDFHFHLFFSDYASVKVFPICHIMFLPIFYEISVMIIILYIFRGRYARKITFKSWFDGKIMACWFRRYRRTDPRPSCSYEDCICSNQHYLL